MENKRNIGIDLLRILLALMVISIHFNATSTGHVSSSVTWMPTKILVYGTDVLVLPAVNIYVIISGFFSYYLMRPYKKVLFSMLKIWLCLEFYSVGGAIFVSILSSNSLCYADIIQKLFPITTGEWWYMSVYFAIMSISPFLNQAVENFSKRYNFIFLVAMLVFCSVIPFFTKYEEPFGVNLGYSFIWFIVLYYTGAVMCKYFPELKNNHFLSLYFLLAIFNVAFSNFTSKSELLRGYSFTKYNSLTLYAQAIFLFYYFKNLSIRSPRIIHLISVFSGLSLAAYIFHCQADIGMTIWKLLNPSQYADSLLLLPVFVATILSIYFISVVIEYVRRKLFLCGDIEKHLICYISNHIQKGVEVLYSKFENIGTKK